MTAILPGLLFVLVLVAAVALLVWLLGWVCTVCAIVGFLAGVAFAWGVFVLAMTT